MNRAVILAATLSLFAAACGNDGEIGPTSSEERRTAQAPPGAPGNGEGATPGGAFAPAADPGTSEPAQSEPAPGEPAPAPSEPAPTPSEPAPTPAPVVNPAPAPASEPVPVASNQRLVAYWASWTRAQMPPKSIAWSRFTHLAHAFVLPAATGGLKSVSTYVDPELIAEAHAHGVKVVASVGGWGANFDANVDPAMRAKTVAALVSLCKNNGYDGIDVDWEFPTATTGAAWGAFISELRAGLDAIDPVRGPKLELGAAISAARVNMAVLPKAALAKLSFVGVMTYDFAGSWSKSIGHHAPLFETKGGDGGSTADAVSYLVDTVGLPANNVLFGLPFYGYTFAGSSLAATQVGPVTNLDYSKIAPMLTGQGYTRGFDATAKVPYLTRPTSPGFVSYEDPTSVEGKCAWSKSRKLGGAIIWHLAGDKMADGSQPLLTAAQACR